MGGGRHTVAVRLTCLNDRDEDEILTTQATSGALLSGGERGTKLLLGSEFMDGLPEMLAKAELVVSARLQKLEAEAEAGAPPGPAAEAAKALEKLSAARQDMNVMSGVRGPFDLAQNEFNVLAALIIIAPEGVARTSTPWIPLRLEIVAVPEVTEPDGPQREARDRPDAALMVNGAG